MKKFILAVLIAATPLLAQVKEEIAVPYIAFPIKMGKGFDTVQANCLTCHSFGYILNQGKQSKAFWRGKVDKMITHFKAPISDKDAETIVGYLYEQYGNDKLK